MRRTLCAILAAAVLPAAASAQLVICVDEVTNEDAWLVDVCTGTSELLWSGEEAWGIAADDSGGKLYSSGGAELFEWDYGLQGTLTPPTFVANFNDGAGGNLGSMLGLAWANGKLYGYTGTGYAIYEIDVTTGTGTVVFNSTGTPSFGGFAFNPDDGLFYLTNDSGGYLSGYGLYSVDVFGGGAETFVVGYPGGETDVDGLAVGGGRAYFITDDMGDEIYTYDLVQSKWIPGATNPLVSTEIFSGGAWAPGLTLTSVPAVYCAAQVNSQGCTPAIASTGTPSLTDPNPFDISVSNIINNKNGLLFYGFDRHNLAFLGGTLCVMPPIKRTVVQNSGGNPPPDDCSGTFSHDFNALIQSGADPNLTVDACVYAQYWSRDPASGPTSNLSDALSFRIAP